jgi:hypothetical protein
MLPQLFYAFFAETRRFFIRRLTVGLCISLAIADFLGLLFFARALEVLLVVLEAAVLRRDPAALRLALFLLAGFLFVVFLAELLVDFLTVFLATADFARVAFLRLTAIVISFFVTVKNYQHFNYIINVQKLYL